MAPKPSSAAFGRLTAASTVALQHLVRQLDDIERRGSTEPALVDAITAQFKHEYEEAVGEIKMYLSLHTLPENLEEEQILSSLSHIKDIYLQGLVIVSRLTRTSAITDSGSCATRDLKSKEVAPTLINELPKLEIPYFDGAPKAWSDFWAKFSSLVGESVSLTPKQKFLYLITHLKGEAHEKVATLPIVDDSYELAVNTLKSRYHNPRLAAQLHCARLLKLPEISSRSSVNIRRFTDELQVNLTALQALKIKNPFELIYVSMLLSKLDLSLREGFEREGFEAQISHANHFPTVQELQAYLTKVAEHKEQASLNSLPSSSSELSSPSNTRSRANKFTSLAASVSSKSRGVNLGNKCLFCDSTEHFLVYCQAWLKLNPRARYNALKGKSCCHNCLRPRHSARCSGKCRKCGSTSHHTLLHFSKSPGPPKTKSSLQAESLEQPSTPNPTVPVVSKAPTSTLVTSAPQPVGIFMATCLVLLTDRKGGSVVVRAILDTASHASFITEAALSRLACAKFTMPVAISGVGDILTQSKKVCHLDVETLSNEPVAVSHMFVVLPKITPHSPPFRAIPEVRQATRNLLLADPTFDVAAPIDALLGADLVAAVLMGETVSLGSGFPVAVRTKFGFVIMGQAPVSLHCNLPCPDNLSSLPLDLVSQYSLHCHFHKSFLSYTSLSTSMDVTYADIKQFWEIEEPPVSESRMSAEEEMAETHYVSTTARLSSGRYQVRLPFKSDPASSLGNSWKGALSRFLSLERRFAADLQFKKQYVDVMRDYIKQGHMTLVTHSTFPKYFVPHHGVYKSRGDTNQLRVVFDASHKTSSGLSLNDILLVGPKLHNLLSDVVTLFRRYHCVVTCDIRQMYRQIFLHSDDSSYLCVLWREDSSAPLEVYAMRTVTFGLACAPFQAMRTLRQLASDEALNYPLAATALQSNIFVDDVATGRDSVSDLHVLVWQLVSLLESGGFQLSKWSTTHSECLPSDIQLSTESFKNVLGLSWNLSHDLLTYPPLDILLSDSQTITKRVFLSYIAKIFDPCGWLAPCVFLAKVLFQQLWVAGLDWDSPIPPELSYKLLCISKDWSDISNVNIPRSLSVSTESECHFTLHGFCDASKLGYAAVIYVVSNSPCGEGSSRLLVAKTKVAPLKVLSIPRLELMGALLLSRLIVHYKTLLSSCASISAIHLWTDSTIVLDWLRIPPYRLKMFVANRIEEIHKNTQLSWWHHVQGSQNIADMASRGVELSTLINSSSWWSGPDWLILPESSWPSTKYSPTSDSLS